MQIMLAIQKRLVFSRREIMHKKKKMGISVALMTIAADEIADLEDDEC